MHHHQSPGSLLDERGDLLNVVEGALHRRPHTLDDVSEPAPGAYLLLYCGPLDTYERLVRPGGPSDQRAMVEAGGFPIYAGSATSLRLRARRHELNVVPCVDIATKDLIMVPLPTRSPAGALYAEAMLITSFQPVWNQAWLAGFGSQPQGRHRRRYQRVPAWNVLHPGRPFDADAPRPEVTRNELARQVVEHLEATVPASYGVRLEAHQPTTPVRRLAVLGHQVGDSRLMGGRPPRAWCRR